MTKVSHSDVRTIGRTSGEITTPVSGSSTGDCADQSTHIAILQFDHDLNQLGDGKTLQDGLSAVLQCGSRLWVANDETLSLEQLTRLPDTDPGVFRYGQHRRFPLDHYLDLPVPPSANPDDPAEADIEGLASADGYLWLIGSHSLKRKNPTLKDDHEKARRQLAKIGRDGNRYLLARIPMSGGEDKCELAKSTTVEGKERHAALLRGDNQGDELTEALQSDEHLGRFLAIPGKDNGFDIEGLAVAGGRIFIGLRGPVLRGWAVILEVAVDDSDSSSTLHLAPMEPGGRRYRKYFLQLGGLGIRDLCVQGSDLLILAGPTMDLDGPVSVFRWPGGASPDAEVLVPASELQWVLDVPYGQGADHAEGMTLFTQQSGQASSLLLVYDAADDRRKSIGSAVTADIRELP